MPNSRPARHTLLILAGILTALLLLEGLVIRAGSVLSPVAVIVLAVLALATVTSSPDQGRRAALDLALVPVAAGLSVATMVLGTVLFPGSVAWWLPGALLSGAPLALAGLRFRPRGATAGRPASGAALR